MEFAANKTYLDSRIFLLRRLVGTSVSETTSHSILQQGAVGARGTFFSVQKVLPLMTVGGAIVLISSGLSYKGLPGHSAYAASKAAIRSFSRKWAAELKDRGIRVNTVRPGPIDTPIINSQADSKEGADAVRAMFVSITPLARMGRPEEIAAAAFFLASSESSFITGFDLVVDDGIIEL